MLQYHAEIRDQVGLRIAEVVPEEERVADERGLKKMATFETCGAYRVFSAIIKDVRLVVPISEWGTLWTEQTEDQTLCYPPNGVVEPCEGSYVAFDARLPILKVGKGKHVDIIHVKQRAPIRDHSDPDRNWARRWREHFKCEPPEGEGVVYEIYTAQTPCSDIAFS